jgi:hypothetical protein
MEPQGSLPHSQEPTTCPYPEPRISSPFPPHFLKIYFNIIHPYTLKFSKLYFYLVSPPKLYTYLSC